MRSRSVGGTTRPAVVGLAGGASRGETGAATDVCGWSPISSDGADGVSTRDSGGGPSATSGSGDDGGANSAWSSASAGAATATTGGLTVFTSRGGGSTGAVGFGGSGAFFATAAPFLIPPLGSGVSAKISPVGSAMLRWRARRSTNCRATTSSIVLDALFTSMP